MGNGRVNHKMPLGRPTTMEGSGRDGGFVHSFTCSHCGLRVDVYSARTDHSRASAGVTTHVDEERAAHIRPLASDKPDALDNADAVAQMPPVVLTVAQFADQLSISKTLAWNLIGRREVKSVKIGKLRRITMAAVHEYLRKLEEECGEY